MDIQTTDLEEYFANYDKLTTSVLFIYYCKLGGLGDYIKFFTYVLYYCIKNNIKMYYLQNVNEIDKYIKIKYNKLYILRENIDKPLIQLRSLNEIIDDNVYYVVYTPILYSEPVYESIYSLHNIFEFTDEVKDNAKKLLSISGDYISIHIRFLDYLLDAFFDDDINNLDNVFKFNQNNICKLIEDNKKKQIVLFSSNMKYKKKLKEKYDFINIIDIEIGHLSYIGTDDAFLNTMSEYYIMINSDCIYCNLLSAFSKTASMFNDISFNLIKE